MDMRAFATALKDGVERMEVPVEAESLLELLYDTYSELNGLDDQTIRDDFDVLYAAMNGKTTSEMDEIIYPVCTLCRDHEKTGFTEGVKVGIRLAQELSI